MSEIVSYVVERLKSYPSMKRRIDQLRFDLESIPAIGELELIESLALGIHSDGEGYRPGSHPSDKTMAIALQYKGMKRWMEQETENGIRQEIRSLELKVSRLEYYVSLLEYQKAAAIRLLYFENKTWDEATQQLHISRQTLFRHRKSAVYELASMYATLCEASGL